MPAGSSTASKKHSPNAGLMLTQRQRRWVNIKPTLGERLVFSGAREFFPERRV